MSNKMSKWWYADYSIGQKKQRGPLGYGGVGVRTAMQGATGHAHVKQHAYTLTAFMLFLDSSYDPRFNNRSFSGLFAVHGPGEGDP